MSPIKPFEPTLSDVLVVRAMLAQTVILPELVGTILDYAEYWARSSAKAYPYESIYARRTGPGEFDHEEIRFLIRSFPVGLTERAYESADGDGSQESELSIESLIPQPVDRELNREFLQQFSGFTISKRPDFSTESPVPRPVDRELDRESFQKIIKYTSTFSNPVRKIIFRVRSHDQGWTTDETPGPFIASKTWFDAGIERFDANRTNGGQKNSTLTASFITGDDNMIRLTAEKLGTIEPKVKDAEDFQEGFRYQFPYTPWQGPYEIQRNRTASPEFTDYEVIWTCWDVVSPDSAEARQLMEQGKGRMAGDGQFVRNLKLGDVVTVWGRAMHRGWVNTVETVEITIYWAL